jgi:hypothetical protein
MSCSTSWPGTTCSNGYCVGGGGGGTTSCTSGSKQCVDGDRYQDCNDGQWSAPYSCSASWPGTTCSNGWCVGS